MMRRVLAGAALQFRTGTLNFSSRSIKPAAAQGQRAQFEGSGTINGAGRFGLKIWHADPATGGAVVDYDNLSAGGNAGVEVQGNIVHQ